MKNKYLSYLTIDAEIPSGAWLKSRGTEDWHLVVNKKGEGYTQETKANHQQSFNHPKAKERIYIFDGDFLNIRDKAEVCKMYYEIYYPAYSNFQLELLKFNRL